MPGHDVVQVEIVPPEATPAAPVATEPAVAAPGATGSGTATQGARGGAAATVPPTKLSAIRRNLGSWSIRALSLAAGILLWYLATRLKIKLFINFENVPSPLLVAIAFVSHLQQQRFFIDIGVSLLRILVSFGLAVVVGIPIGVLIGRVRLARDIISPWIEVLRPIPAVAWIPLAILLWPTEESSIIFITFLGALFPIVLNTATGAEHTPVLLLRAARSLGAPPAQIFRHVVIPAAMPSIGAGLAIGMGVAWFSLLAGEIISGQYGIGYFTWNAYSLINYPDIVVGMLMIGLLGTLSTALVRFLMRPFVAWQTRGRG